jgi:iron(III) transport system ATP-binding protein
MADLIVNNLRRDFGSFAAVDGISFTARNGEFVTLLGPSGCGKSTTLWMVAGLNRPTGGTISLGTEVIVDCANGQNVAAEERDFGLVFQSYALWPHMTVRQNLEFPLKLRRMAKKERETRIEEALSLVELNGQSEKFPFQLSGGQQQRVALARTIVYQPRLLLLDEPLSNLDAKLRERARIWLRDLQRRLGVTALYVTHDQDEALAMSDRILVMNGGHIVQNGTPEDVYCRPADPFVASFVGSSNFLVGRVDRANSGVRLDALGLIPVILPPALADDHQVIAAVRPERIRLATEQEKTDAQQQVLVVDVRSVAYLGNRYQALVGIGGVDIRLETDMPPLGEQTKIAIRNDSWMIFPQNVQNAKGRMC